MARVELDVSSVVEVSGAWDTLAEAEAHACEIFTCIIAAVGRTDQGVPYFRPVASRDSTIFAYAVLVLASTDHNLN